MSVMISAVQFVRHVALCRLSTGIKINNKIDSADI